VREARNVAKAKVEVNRNFDLLSSLLHRVRADYAEERG
jgi:hypothetical protein